jgi:putative ABC transport system permease protein
MPWIVMDNFFNFRNRPNLDLREAQALEDKLRGRAIVNPTMDGRKDAKYRDEVIEGVNIVGTTEKQMRLSSVQPQTGRFLLPFDVQYKKNVCVIGTDVKDGLFGSADPVGKSMFVGRTEFRVIGVMEKQGGSFFGGPNFDRQIYVPITSYVKAFGGGHGHEDVNIAVKAPTQEALKDLEFEVIGEMRKIRQLRPSSPDNFSINKLDTLVGSFNSTMGVVLTCGFSTTFTSFAVSPMIRPVIVRRNVQPMLRGAGVCALAATLPRSSSTLMYVDCGR